MKKKTAKGSEAWVGKNVYEVEVVTTIRTRMFVAANKKEQAEARASKEMDDHLTEELEKVMSKVACDVDCVYEFIFIDKVDYVEPTLGILKN